MEDSAVKTPWKPYLGEVPFHIEYFNGSMCGAVFSAAEKYPGNTAFVFFGRKTSYKTLVKGIKKCAAAFESVGIHAGDVVTVALPNCPQAVYVFYALNMIGAIANMVHPLSAEKEIEFFLTDSGSRAVVTLDKFYGKVSEAVNNTGTEKIIVTGIEDGLGFLKSFFYSLKESGKKVKIPYGENIIGWNDFLRLSEGAGAVSHACRDIDRSAVILYSGGTTGVTKGIVLSDKNFNALAAQIIASNPMFAPGDKMLAAMPLFHGFGLGVCVHSMLANGGACVLIPRFTPKSYAGQISKHKCAFIAGVPTLYEALLRLPGMEKADFSSLKGVFSGGDSLTPELKKKFDSFLSLHGAKIPVREGYGTTETVTACCLTPPHMHKEGSIGVPFPDTYMKIVIPGTETELPYGEEGEILISGPTVMKEYLNMPEETAEILQKHNDGLVWVKTGDLGVMDDCGFIYFKGRIKRIIVSSGYNIYPAQIENVLDSFEKIQMSCVIGIPDPYKMRKVKAFVKLNPDIPKSESVKQEILEYCKNYIAKYALPSEIEFRDDFPKTPIGKIAYRILEEEESSEK